MRSIITILIVLASLSCAFAATDTSLTLTIGNALPSLGNISVITNLNLSGSGNTSFWCNATVTDNNGNGNIAKINSTFWNTAEANESSNNSVSYHYTNDSCELAVATNLSKHTHCYFSLSNETVLGNWSCKINAFDSYGGVSNTTTVHVYKCGDDDCDYGENCSSCEADCGSCSPDTGTGASGNSGGYIANNSYYKLESVGSYEKWVVVGDELTFSVGDEDHKLKITSITSEAITIEVSSNPIKVLILIGETKFFDLDGDGWYDVSIYLNKINAGRANLGIELFAKKLINEATEGATSGAAQEPLAEPPEKTAEIGQEVAAESPVPLGTGIVTVAVLIVSGIIVYFIVKRGGK